MAKRNRRQMALLRHQRIRKFVKGTPQRPRLAIFRSNSQIYAQVIDDVKGVTLANAGSLGKDQGKKLKGLDSLEVAKAVGKAIGENAQAAGISAVVFDRGGCKYHGRVKALAEGARETGLEF